MVPPSLVRNAAFPHPVAGDVVARRRANVRASVSAEVRRLIVWSVVLGAAGVCLLLGYVWVRLMVVEAGYRLSVTRQLVEGSEREGRELAVRAAAADSAAHLETLATTRLGMRRPERGEEEPLP
jgi:cell division protein FtsL